MAHRRGRGRVLGRRRDGAPPVATRLEFAAHDLPLEQDACVVGADGRYLRGDAEALYQRSRVYDRRANRWLVGAQLSLIATTALFIIDLHPGDGPENIPFPANQIQVGPVGDGVGLGMRVAF